MENMNTNVRVQRVKGSIVIILLLPLYNENVFVSVL